MLKVGDKVLFSSGMSDIKHNLGIIIDKKDENYVVVNMLYSYKYVLEYKKMCKLNTNNIIKVRQDIIDLYNPQIDELKSKIRFITDEEKNQEHISKYNNIKNQILKNCERIILSIDDDDFEDRLKTICELKKSLFSIKIECKGILRKQNGTIKHDIRELEYRMKKELELISDENIIKAFEYK